MQKSGGEDSQDMNLGEIQKLIDTAPRKLTENTLMGVGASEPVSDNEQEVESENKLAEEF